MTTAITWSNRVGKTSTRRRNGQRKEENVQHEENENGDDEDDAYDHIITITASSPEQSPPKASGWHGGGPCRRQLVSRPVVTGERAGRAFRLIHCRQDSWRTHASATICHTDRLRMANRHLLRMRARGAGEPSRHSGSPTCRPPSNSRGAEMPSPRPAQARPRRSAPRKNQGGCLQCRTARAL